MWAHGLWRFLGHTDRALTWEGDTHDAGWLQASVV